MAEQYSFFNSKDHDRKYNARHWADYFYPLFKSGVFNGDLQVVANGGMSVKIKAGYAWIDGYAYHLTDSLVLDMENASGNLNREDNIVIRLDLTNRWIRAFYVPGTYYTTAVPPEPQISATVHELVIARISVAAGTTEITQDMIEDTRMNDNLCGWVCGAVKQIEFEQIYAQFDAFQKSKAEEINRLQNEATKGFWDWFDESKQNWSTAVMDWFNNLKNQLDGNVAIKLQNQIGNLSDLSTQDKSNLVAAINEARDAIPDLTTSLAVTEEGVVGLDGTVGKVLNDKIDALNNSFSQSLGGVTFGVDADGNYGYRKPGADTVTPFKGNMKFNVSGTFAAEEHPYNPTIEFFNNGNSQITLNKISTKNTLKYIITKDGVTSSITSALSTKTNVIDISGVKDVSVRITSPSSWQAINIEVIVE